MWEAIVNYDLHEIINRAVAYGIIIAIFLSVVFIFVGGISFIISGGDEAKVKGAVHTIRNAIFGLIISFLAVLIVATVGKALGLEDVLHYIDLDKVFNLVENIGREGGPENGLEGEPTDTTTPTESTEPSPLAEP